MAGALWQRLVEVSISYASGLLVELSQGVDGSAYGLIAEEHEQGETETDDNPYDDKQTVVAGEDVTLRTNDGYAPAGTLQGTIEDEGITAVNDSSYHTAVTGKHGVSHSIDVVAGLGSCIAEDGLMEELSCVGVYEIGAVSAEHDG